MTTLPGWTTTVAEISNGVFKVTLTDSFGRIAEITNNGIDDTIQRAYEYAFEIEKQVSVNWSKFLYEVCLSQLSDTTITRNNYNSKMSGSWLVQIDTKRLLYLGKGNWLITQFQNNSTWFDQALIKKEELTFALLSTVTRQIRPKFRIT